MAMQMEHEFTVPVPVDQAWPVLLDVERVAPCMPGATLDSVDGDAFTGRLKVKVGPITVTYRGNASFSEKDEATHTVVLEASGKEARGSGTASATVQAALSGLPGSDGQTKVEVRTTFNVTGRPAQFGRGVLSDVGGRLIDRFAERLAGQLGAGDGDQGAEPTPTAATEDATAVPRPRGTDESGAADGAAHVNGASPAAAAAGEATSAPVTRPVVADDQADDAIDLLDVAGVPVLKRVVPVAGAVALGFVLWRLVRRRRSH